MYGVLIKDYFHENKILGKNVFNFTIQFIVFSDIMCSLFLANVILYRLILINVILFLF